MLLLDSNTRCPYCGESSPSRLTIGGPEHAEHGATLWQVGRKIYTWVCCNCLALRIRKKLRIGTCSRCGKPGVPLVKHHVQGKEKSVETVDVCMNCHSEIHCFNMNEFEP